MESLLDNRKAPQDNNRAESLLPVQSKPIDPESETKSILENT